MKKKDTPNAASTHLEHSGLSHLRHDYESAAKGAVFSAIVRGREWIRGVIIAGQCLNEWQEAAQSGDFGEIRKRAFPEISERCLQVWQQCADVILKKAINLAPLPASNLRVSAILQNEVSDPDLLPFKKQWDDLVVGSSLNRILSERDSDPVAAARALNGNINGGTNKYDNRKDFPQFAARNLASASSHLAHYETMDELQKKEVKDILESLVTGKQVMLDREAMTLPHACKPLHMDLVDFLESVIRRRRKIASYEGKSISQG